MAYYWRRFCRHWHPCSTLPCLYRCVSAAVRAPTASVAATSAATVSPLYLSPPYLRPPTTAALPPLYRSLCRSTAAASTTTDVPTPLPLCRLCHWLPPPLRPL